MFSKSRPAPSKATLKFLYRLAYVSSGTAAGIATLCTEERRRQTAIVQKIADNARRIRQSPRYRHHKARAKANELADNDRFQHDDGNSHTTSLLVLNNAEGSKDDRKVRGAASRSGIPDRDVRAPELPSAVEHGYQQLIEKNHKRRRRRISTADDHVRKDATSQETRLPGEPDPDKNSSARRKAHLKSRHDLAGSPYRLTPTFERALDSDTLLRTYILQRYDEAASAKENQLAGKPLHPRPTFRMPLLKSSSNRMSAKKESAVQATMADINHDVELFFQSVPWANERNSEALHEQDQTASTLLRLVSNAGMRIETRSLCLWMLSHSNLRESDVRGICKHCPALASRADFSDYEDLISFYVDLFTSTAFCSYSAQFRVWAIMRVLTDITTWHVEFKLRVRWGSAVLRFGSLEVDPGALDEERERVCDSLVERGGISRATELFLMQDRDQPKNWTLGDRLLGHAAAQGNLSVVQRLLVRKLNDPGYYLKIPKSEWPAALQDEVLIPQLERHILSCAQHKAYKFMTPIVSQLGNRRRRWWIEGLNVHARIAIAIVCTFHKKFAGTALFNELYEAIPADRRELVEEAYSVHRLKDIWESTRDLNASWQQYEATKEWQRRVNGHDTFGKAELALMEICRLAGQPHRGIPLLEHSRKQDGAPESTSLSLAFATLASSSSWSQLEKLLEMTAVSGHSINGEFATRTLNNVLRLYAQQHTATEMWDFVVKGLINGIGFRPDQVTTKVLLTAFARKRAFALIPAWCRYLKSTDQKFSMDSKSVASFMNEFYVEFRLLHGLYMWLCRSLCLMAPSLRPLHFQQTIKAAISYDLRNLDVQDPDVLKELAYKNLDKLPAMDRDFPIPVRKSDWAKSQIASGNFSPRLREYMAYRKAMGDRSWINTGNDDNVLITSLTTSPKNDTPMPIRHSLTGPRAEPKDLPAEVHTSTSSVYQPFAFDEKSTADAGEKVDGTETYNCKAFETTSLITQEGVDVSKPISEPTSDRLEKNGADAVFLDESGEDTLDRYYESEDMEPSEDMKGDGRIDVKAYEQNMIVEYSLKNYHRVIELYQQSTTASGLPLSPRVLEVAVQSQIDLDGGLLHGARERMREAQEAGFNVTCAMGPLIIHELRLSSPRQRQDAEALRSRVIDYYRMNDENGWRVSHHVGVTVAHALVKNRRSEHAINLLNAIHLSEWTRNRALDIVAMTIYVRGYAALGNQKGILWAVQKVIQSKIRISRKFLLALQQAAATFRSSPCKRESSARFAVVVSELRTRCIQERAKQRKAAMHDGLALIRTLGSCFNAQAEPDEVWEKIEEGHSFGPGSMEERGAEEDEELLVDARLDALEEAGCLGTNSVSRMRRSGRRNRRAMRLTPPMKREPNSLGGLAEREWFGQLDHARASVSSKPPVSVQADGAALGMAEGWAGD